MARGYLRIIVFVCGLLAGVQLPGFMDQYQKRVDAHLQEAQKNLSGFRDTADRYFQGDIESLIGYYKESNDPVFSGDAGSVEKIYRRWQMLRSEQEAIAGPWYTAALHLVFFYNDELLKETFSHYSYTVPLTPQAVAWGVGIAFLVSFVTEAFILAVFFGASRLVRKRRDHIRA
ncbi:MAG: DUF2937 family protein [Desulfobacteraceae bacterium]|nr:DUF2937 family protein [Desulfobacteraceae bacterium]MCF8096130.1 DUF2937 family protein [Desulfobacteraceae bacterium]